MSSSSSSQSVGSGGRYDVYLSFYGPDVGNSFLPYLNRSLCKEGVRACLNVDALRKGEGVSSPRFKSIKIAILILSKNFASSDLCLGDLMDIMDRSKQGEFAVLPVFYGVDDTEVRSPRKSFARALCAHRKALGKDSEKLRRWREALSQAGTMSGWCLSNHGTDAELARSIIERIRDLLGRASVEVARYDVFLSFRGPDTRDTIISHLYEALCQKGVETFKDNEKLEAGQRRSELFEAIKGSCIAVVMFSENYANSKWCLDELKTIMERKEMNLIAVIPIFYRMSPREVRLYNKENGSKGCYQIAIEEMEAKYGEKNPKMVESWKKALWKGGDLIGFSLRQGDDEGSLVKKVVGKVLKILNRVPLEVAENPVGMTSRLEDVKPFLHIDPHTEDVSVLGILGLGGVGKTTLSKAILKEHFHKFDDWCFLPNIREESGALNGLALLQQKLLRKLLAQENLTVSSVDEGKVLIKERLRSKAVLVILDDVDKYDQFDALAGDLNWFGKRSRIIITTRDRHMLPSDRVQHVYEQCPKNHGKGIPETKVFELVRL
ncbi:hypothetical protein MLD38_003183 [Melastoma candidum]|uniref:Uncharacterized protein n=1 Tax=Melastoma candidum TaxID=119954 RepID=A0ACB9S1X8_9MYRT|nr:hypothetical protein MLD38_003183 [Melastoma candidum]